MHVSSVLHIHEVIPGLRVGPRLGLHVKLEKVVQLMAHFRIFPSSESRHGFVAKYTSAVKSKIHILVLFCCIIIPLYVSESKYL